MTRNKLIVVGSSIILGTASLGTLSVPALAVDQTSYPPIVQKLAEKFKLNPEEIQSVFTETRKEEHTDNLEGLVEEGKITEEQKAIIDSHHDEMMTKMEALRAENKTREEIHEALEVDREEFKTWLDEQNIELPMGGPRGNGEGIQMRRGFGKGQGMGMGAGKLAD